jgi:hypothetical protein
MISLVVQTLPVVLGGGTLKVDGDYDCTIGGNANFTVDNDINFKGKGFNVAASGNIDMAGQNLTVKTAGSGAFHSEGSFSVTADGSVGMMSRSGSAVLAGATQVGIAAAGGEVAISSGGATHIKAGGVIAQDGSQIYLNSGMAQEARAIITGPKAASPSKQSSTSRIS